MFISDVRWKMETNEKVGKKRTIVYRYVVEYMGEGMERVSKKKSLLLLILNKWNNN